MNPLLLSQPAALDEWLAAVLQALPSFSNNQEALPALPFFAPSSSYPLNYGLDAPSSPCVWPPQWQRGSPEYDARMSCRLGSMHDSAPCIQAHFPAWARQDTRRAVVSASGSASRAGEACCPKRIAPIVTLDPPLVDPVQEERREDHCCCWLFWQYWANLRVPLFTSLHVPCFPLSLVA